MSSVRKGSCQETQYRSQTENKSRSTYSSATVESWKDDGKTRRDMQREEQGQKRSSPKQTHRKPRSQHQQRSKFRTTDTLLKIEEQASVKIQGNHGTVSLKQSDVASKRRFSRCRHASPPSPRRSYKSRWSNSQQTRNYNRYRTPDRSRFPYRPSALNRHSSRYSSHSSGLSSPPNFVKRLVDPLQEKQTEMREVQKHIQTSLKRKVEEGDSHNNDFKRKSNKKYPKIAGNADAIGGDDISVLANEGRHGSIGLTQSYVATDFKRTFNHRPHASSHSPPRSGNSRWRNSKRATNHNQYRNRDRSRSPSNRRTRTQNQLSSRYSSHPSRLFSPAIFAKRPVDPVQGKQTEMRETQKDIRTSIKRKVEEDNSNRQNFKRKSKEKYSKTAGKAEATRGDEISVLANEGHPAFFGYSKTTITKEKSDRGNTPGDVRRASYQDPRLNNFKNSEKTFKTQRNVSQRYGRHEISKKSSSSENYCCNPLAHHSNKQVPNREQKRKIDGDSILSNKYIHNLNEMSPIEILKKLNENLSRLEVFLNSSSEEQFLKDVLHVLAECCKVSQPENINPLLTVVRNSLFFSNHVKAYLQLLQCNESKMTDVDQTRAISDMIRVFSACLRHFPSSYSDIPLEMLQRTIEMMQVEKKIELENSLAALKAERDAVIKAERRRFAKLFQKQETKQMKPPDNYREIQICPTLKELNSNEKPFLRKNIKKGKYEDAEHYLDVQFRLYREDFIAPLREGIQEVVNKVPKKERNQDIKLYHNVRIHGKEFTKSGIVHKVVFDQTRFRFTNWNHSKRLIFGSFLCLSKDDFKTMLFATVANRDPTELKNGRFDIQFLGGQDVVGIEKQRERFIIAESPAYFEAYRHVLVGLQGLTEDNLPFKKYLVECSPDVDSPLYLRRYEEQDLVTYNLREVFKNQSAPDVKVLVTNEWPQAETLPLNVSQLEAFQTAITKEFTVIQGPPGTGKTYVGLKIVQALLENRRVWDPRLVSPMLMVCFTNHALDQFLEGVKEFLPNGIIRAGGRCKSDHLQKFNLRNFVNHDTGKSKIYSEMKEMEDEFNTAKAFSEVPDNGILMFNELEEVIEDRFLNQLYYHPSLIESKTVSDLFEAWLLNKLPSVRTQIREKDSTKVRQESKQNPRTVHIHDASDLKRGLVEDKEQFLSHHGGSVQEEENAFKNHNSAFDIIGDVVERNENEKNIVHFQKEEKREVDKHSESEQTFTEATENVFKTDTEENCSSHAYPTSKKNRLEIEESLSVARVKIEEEKVEAECTLLGFEKDYASKGSDNIEREEGECSECSETIDVDSEADLLQSQRYQEGEEDMFSPIRNVNETILDQRRSVHSIEDEKETRFHQGRSHRKQTSSIKIGREDLERANKLISQGNGFEKNEVEEIVNMWLLSDKERIRLYLYWVACFCQRWRMAAEQAKETYKILCHELDRTKAEEDGRALRQATVIGMTTSCAARYHSVLQQIRPKIVIIEEAAEVLEAHILTSLTQDTEHVILIGDHKQLRPKPTVYQLAQKFNLEISLFERMVLNKMDCKQLCIQHRMRPEIARLTKRIYDHEIFDSDRVKCYPNIIGMQKNMYFLDHTEQEEFQEGLQSYSNKHEADFVVALCRYLLQQGYETWQITILTMYTGQLLKIKANMPLSLFKGVRLSAVDNFQGEENDVVILSLVRSNKQENVGFVKEPNRICVSLSRARMGFYVIGNFSLLCSQSPLWRDICKDIKSERQLGSTMPLICEKHGNVTNVKTAEDFKKVPEGGCNEPCEDRLKCGHVCVLRCHPGDPKHIRYKCRKKCLKRCPEGHPCKETCHYDRECAQCRVEVAKTFPACGHDIKTDCGIDIQKLLCERLCEKKLECGHQCSRKCFESCNSNGCQVIVEKTLSCHHTKSVPCSKYPIKLQCTKKCTKLLDCQHKCPGKCYQICNKQVCEEKVEKFLSCGHRIEVICSEHNNAIECQEPCNRKLLCGHNCPSECHETCPHDHCKVRVLKTLPCNHEKEMECHKSPSDVFCNDPCERILPCGHSCLQGCGNVCQRVNCSEIVDNTFPCGHSQPVRCGDYPNFVCKSSCDKMLCLRDHRCKQICHVGKEPCGRCTKPVKMRMPKCNHEVLAECWKEPSAINCNQPCERTLACGHGCKLKCGENCETSVCKEKMTKKLECGHTKHLPCFQDEKDYKCAVKVKKKLPCGHDKKCSCHQKPEEVMCNVSVTTTLDTCGHAKSLPCSEAKRVQEGKVAAVYCEVIVSKTLPCGHEMKVDCGQDPKKAFCQAPCERNLPCGSHRCTNRCGDDCSKSACQVKCTRRLKCGHRCSGLCGKNCPKCKEKCGRLLPCYHTCQGLCGEPCDPSKCTIRVIPPFPCGHKVEKGVPCCISMNAKCKQKCQRQLLCGHICPGECGVPCDQFKCRAKITKNLQCGHSVIVTCFQFSEAVECRASCAIKLPCGHACDGVCGKCREAGSHKKCHLPCGRILVCSHRCRAPCNEPCPPCTRPCQRSCIHGRCRKLCYEDCKPCLLPCAWSCLHFQCNNLCYENCERPFCNESCPKRLRCGHPCIGLCGEMCPRLCRVCNPRQLEAIVPGSQQNINIRFVQLFDCGHVFEVSFLDQWMHTKVANAVGSGQIYLQCCPVCPVPVIFSFRYSDAAKRNTKKLDSVKLEIKEMAKVSDLRSQAFVHQILRSLRFPRKLDLDRLISHGRFVDGDTISDAFLLRNHMVVLRVLQEMRIRIETIRYKPTRSAFSVCNPPDSIVSQIKDQVENYLQSPIILSDMLHHILMDPQPDMEVIMKLYHSTVLVSLILDLVDIKCDHLQEFKTLSSDSETALNDILNTMVAETEGLAAYANKTRSVNLPILLQWKTITQLENEVNRIRQDAGLQPLEELPCIKLVSFPGLCKSNWFSCKRGHVFARFQTGIVSARCGSVVTVAECQKCRHSDDLAVGKLHS